MIKILDWERVKTPEEKQFLKSLIEYEKKFVTQNRSLFTDFYNKDWMQDVLQRYLGCTQQPGLKYFGGYEDAERAVAGFVDEYNEDEPICALRINVKTGPQKALSHRDYLGALLGLGIERSKLGDIIIDEQGAYLIVKPPLDEYIQWNVTSIGRYSQIEIRQIDFSEIKAVKPTTKAIRGTVASLRADSIFALAFGISRSTAAKLLQHEKGLRFGSSIESSTILKEGDVCVLRGYGKFRLENIGGQTRKDRISIAIEKYV